VQVARWFENSRNQIWNNGRCALHTPTDFLPAIEPASLSQLSDSQLLSLKSQLQSIKSQLLPIEQSQVVGGRKRSVKSSNYRGISWNSRKWRAQIKQGGNSFYLGCFPTEVEAAVAYDAAARRCHGKRAKLNFAGEGEQQARTGMCIHRTSWEKHIV
jgi:hypothetical protein